MNCEEALKLMDGYLDAELDPITNQGIERHLRDCRKCERVYAEQRTLVRAIGSAAPYHKASADLRRQVQSALRNEIGSEAARSLSSRRQMTVPPKREGHPAVFAAPWNWLAIAAAIILAAIITWNLAPRLQQRDSDQFLATQLIASHVRSLMASHLTDVASSDQHTVKPWLDERLDFAAPVVDLTSEGFPLVGGRLDYLDNRPVAALVYQRRKHFINLFIWLAKPNTRENTRIITRQGYQLLHWGDSDFNYWAVSDVNADDLQQFKRLFEKQVPHH